MSVQHQSKITRSPAIGAVQRNSEVTVTFEIPIDFEIERPHLLTRSPDLAMTTIRSSDVVLRNTGSEDALYALVVLPKIDLLGAAHRLVGNLMERYAATANQPPK